MNKIALKTADETNEVFLKYADMLYGVCVLQMRNKSDAEDAVSETMIKYMCSSPQFESEEHRKAWLIRVAINLCHDMQRKAVRKSAAEDNCLFSHDEAESDCVMLSLLMTLDDKYRTALYLHYVEQYTVKEIADMTGTGSSAVKMRLKKGRELLKNRYERGAFNE